MQAFVVKNSSRLRIENQLRTPEQGERFPAGFIRHFGIPDLGRAAGVNFI